MSSSDRSLIESNAGSGFAEQPTPAFTIQPHYKVPNYRSTGFALQCRASAYQELTVLGGLLEPLVPRPFDVRTHLLVGSIARRLQEPIAVCGQRACVLGRRSNGARIRNARVDARTTTTGSN